MSIGTLASPLTSAVARIGRVFARPRAGHWALAAGARGMVAAHVGFDALGEPHLDAVEFLDARGDRPARRGADVAAAMRAFSSPCVVVLSPADYRSVFLPGLPVPAQERSDALRWRLRDEIDFPVQDAVIDCVVAPVSHQMHEHGLWMAVAAPSSKVHELIGPLSEAGIEIAAVDVPELAQRNLCMRLTAPERTAAMLTMDAQHGLLTVCRGDGVLASRQLDPIAVTLSGDDDERRAAMIERLALEIQRTFDNVERQYGAAPPDRVHLLVERHADQVAEGLRNSIAAAVEPISFDSLCAERDLNSARRAALDRTAALAVGAALRGSGEGVAR
ncbi:MAG: hypothetical protein KJZ83_11915 [Burkholderiaceae bacterium]|nr:hypothetical protein [Burkholderiaceae bacterium]